MAAAKILDIEAALEWAYRHELPKRQAGGRRVLPAIGLPSTSPMFRGSVAAEGYSGTREPGFPAALGEPHADALAIEAAVNALRSFAGWTFNQDPGVMSGFDPPSHKLDWRAVVAEATAQLPATMALHARMGTRPRWQHHWPIPHAVTGQNGKPVVVVDQVFVEVRDASGEVRHVAQGGPDDPGDGLVAYCVAVASPSIRKNTYAPGTYCPVSYRPAPASLIAARVEYCCWRWALDHLHAELAGELSALELFRPAQPWAPWRGDGALRGQAPVLIAAAGVSTREASAIRRRRVTRIAESPLPPAAVSQPNDYR